MAANFFVLCLKPQSMYMRRFVLHLPLMKLLLMVTKSHELGDCLLFLRMPIPLSTPKRTLLGHPHSHPTNVTWLLRVTKYQISKVQRLGEHTRSPYKTYKPFKWSSIIYLKGWEFVNYSTNVSFYLGLHLEKTFRGQIPKKKLRDIQGQ